MKSSRLLIIGVIIALLTISIATIAQDEDELEQVTVALGAPHAIVFLPFDIADAQGYFEEEGLDVTFEYFEGGSVAASALKDGSVTFSGHAIDHNLVAQIEGIDLRMIADFTIVPCVTLVGRSDLADELESLSDLQGRNVGITRQGSATHILVVFLATSAGLSADDFEVVEVGSSNLAQAIEDQTVDAAMGTPPFTTRLINDGEVFPMVNLCDPEEANKDIGGELPFTGLHTRQDVIEASPETVQKMVNAIVKAQEFIITHTPEEIAEMLPEEALGGDIESYIQALEANLPTFNTNGGVTDPDGLVRVVEMHKIFGTIDEDATIDLDALYDNTFAEVSAEEQE